MVHTYIQNGKVTADINVFIDIQGGFSDVTLSPEQGGVLYVPGGEEVAPIAGDIIANTRNGIFVITQDNHPEHHISFMTNHKGVMDYRIDKFKNFLKENGQTIPEDYNILYAMAQEPVHTFDDGKTFIPFPFENIILDKDGNIAGLLEANGKIKKVLVETHDGKTPSADDRGRIAMVLDEYEQKSLSEFIEEGGMIQTLWKPHCEQGKESSYFPKSMNLPEGFIKKIQGDLVSPVVSYYDKDTGNLFKLVRKGMNPNVDSYSFGLENNRITKTQAETLFKSISEDFEKEGIQQVNVNIGGLATNFCVEASANDLPDFLFTPFKNKGMEANAFFIPEISRGIPIAGGKHVPFSLDGAPLRMEERGILPISVAEIKAKNAKAKPANEVHGGSVLGGQELQLA